MNDEFRLIDYDFIKFIKDNWDNLNDNTIKILIH